MTRFDLYTHVHKAIRLLLFDAVDTVGRTDFSRDEDIEPVLFAVRRTLRMMHAHAHHEDEAIHPVLHRVAPDLAAELEAAHDKFDGLGREIEAGLVRIGRGSASERVSLGRRLHDMLGILVAEYLFHMAAEESRANRMLWAHLTDAELIDVQGRIMNTISPEEMRDWIEWMIQAGNWNERVDLVAALRGTVPAEVFGPLTERGRAAVGEAQWSALICGAEERSSGRASSV
jgi:hypothetical protein